MIDQKGVNSGITGGKEDMDSSGITKSSINDILGSGMLKYIIVGAVVWYIFFRR